MQHYSFKCCFIIKRDAYLPRKSVIEKSLTFCTKFNGTGNNYYILIATVYLLICLYLTAQNPSGSQELHSLFGGGTGATISKTASAERDDSTEDSE